MSRSKEVKKSYLGTDTKRKSPRPAPTQKNKTLTTDIENLPVSYRYSWFNGIGTQVHSIFVEKTATPRT
ncbi:hypothetical protein OAH34_01800 [bacterium]|nr:hypothetical protein [bacterium]